MHPDQPPSTTSSEASHSSGDDSDFVFEYSNVAPSSPRPGSTSGSFQYVSRQNESPTGTPVLSADSSAESSPESVQMRSSSTLVSPGTIKGLEPADPRSYYSIHGPPGFIPSSLSSPEILLKKYAGQSTPTPLPKPKPLRNYSVSAFHARASSFKEAEIETPNSTVGTSEWSSSLESRASAQLLDARVADVARLEQELQMQKKHVNELSEQVRSLGELTKDNAALRTTITNLRAERKGVEGRVVEASKEAAALRDKLKIEERKVVVEEIVTLEDAKDSAEAARTAALQEAHTSEAACQQLRDTILQATTERDKLSNQLAPLSEAFQKSETALATLTAALGQRTHELQVKTAALGARDSTEAALRAELGQATSKIQRLADDLVAITAEKVGLVALLAETKTAHAKLDEQLADGGNARANDELRERNKVHALEEQVTCERERAEKDKAALVAAVARIDDLAAQLERAKSTTVLALPETLAKLQSEITQLRATAASDDRARHKLLREKAEMGDLIRDLLTALEEQESPAQPEPVPASTSSRHSSDLSEGADESGGETTPTPQRVGRAFSPLALAPKTGLTSVGRAAIPSGSMSPDVVKSPPTPSPDVPSSPLESSEIHSITSLLPESHLARAATSSPQSEDAAGGSSDHLDRQEDPLDSGEAGLAIGGVDNPSSSSGNGEEDDDDDKTPTVPLTSDDSIAQLLEMAETITNSSSLDYTSPASGGDDSDPDEEL